MVQAEFWIMMQDYVGKKKLIRIYRKREREIERERESSNSR